MGCFQFYSRLTENEYTTEIIQQYSFQFYSRLTRVKYITENYEYIKTFNSIVD
ncbi:hypothetical protein J5U23_01729 [Saccharolobus shibatae B12]|uniref:Uncharacterized protein n=1 Tax=Saccharolobus shibatae (strain ATCC 51178 / DSM 5389 / JCM 8931 / NBRC 15437 / B12) TaxID=523848 RepID=A0A8F5GTG1_SACSH|nr:hypothetical protein J5U23_01729 [Saccharolobus shibatae B12]